jgi:hypothetical protein
MTVYMIRAVVFIVPFPSHTVPLLSPSVSNGTVDDRKGTLYRSITIHNRLLDFMAPWTERGLIVDWSFLIEVDANR